MNEEITSLDQIDDGSEVISGSFMCDRCYETVKTARLDTDKGILTFICPEGHKSKVKDFV